MAICIFSLHGSMFNQTYEKKENTSYTYLYQIFYLIEVRQPIPTTTTNIYTHTTYNLREPKYTIFDKKECAFI